MNYYAISDKHWERLSHILPTEGSPKGGRPAKNVRTFINAIIWLLRTGSPWRALPEEFGAWQSVYSRFRRWEKRGYWQAMFQVFTLDAELSSVMIDGSYVHAHKHAAGAKGGSNAKLWEVVEEVLQRSFTS